MRAHPARSLLCAVIGSVAAPVASAEPADHQAAVLMLQTKSSTALKQTAAAVDRAVFDGLVVQVGGERLLVEAGLKRSLCRRRRCRYPDPDQIVPVTVESLLRKHGGSCRVTLRMFETTTTRTLAHAARSSHAGCETLLAEVPTAMRALVAEATVGQAPEVREPAAARRVRDRLQATRREIRTRGLLMSDLPPGYQGHLAGIQRAMGDGDYALALELTEQLQRVVKQIEVEPAARHGRDGPTGQPPRR